MARFYCVGGTLGQSHIPHLGDDLRLQQSYYAPFAE
jgi:hypothetical protein